MQADQKREAKSFKYTSTVSGDKLLLELNSDITYKGQIPSSPYYDINDLKKIFDKGEVEILVKTTTILKLQLLSQDNLQIQQLKNRIQQLELKLKTKQDNWEQEDLNSTTPFDINYIYRMSTSSGYSCLSIYVNTSNIYFAYINNNTGYNVAATNKKSYSVGHTVTKLMKKKI